MSLLQEFRNSTLAFPKRFEGGNHQGFHHGSVENAKKFGLACYKVSLTTMLPIQEVSEELNVAMERVFFVVFAFFASI